ncbi:hypothetical protein T11_13964 [Trichinella zimbabwensis]|uniref:ShKT domain-containing protein n=2 Tax=Trichinella TaxID=6333 RepID=A0A0V1N955_9BILA|nr:hypothetical protein T11_13964 [Trichinella zimbabwensis]KRZ80561.1 hypothetical protein T10_13155 [Trichinella papuae]
MMLAILLFLLSALQHKVTMADLKDTVLESTYAYCAYSKCQEERACYEESEIQSTRLICSEAYESCQYSCSLMSLVSSELMQKIKDFEKSSLQKDYNSTVFHNHAS